MQSISLRILMGSLWLILSISLGTWWAIIGLRQSESIAQLKANSGISSNTESLEYIEKQHRMIRSEGIFFLFLIAGGGLAIITMSVRDVRRNKMIKDFFATVTHEMKTPLASLRLQAESLEDVLETSGQKKLVKRLIGDTSRLELQMDKAMYLASISRAEILLMESVNLKEILEILRLDYEFLTIETEDISILGDRRALESILRNIVENSYHHGQATKIYLKVFTKDQSCLIDIVDNGTGFTGDIKKLGKLFHRHNSRSGSGVGLFLVKTLLRKMNGNVNFYIIETGFKVSISLPLSH